MANLSNSLINTNDDLSNNKGEVSLVAQHSMATKELATIQGQIFMAKQFPRDNNTLMRRVQSACERPYLAKLAEYEYARGGTTVTGASIKLIETIAQNYGNLTWSWKELERADGKSKVLAYAWDLETNARVELEFIVPLKREKKVNGKLVSEEITSERDIYELIASNAQRRVRKCLEGIIPRDIVEQALEWCNETINSKVDIQAGIDKAIEFFAENYGVTIKQIEEKYGMSRRAFTKNTYLSLQRIYTSVKDGVMKIEEAFPPVTVDLVGGNPLTSGKNTKAPSKDKDASVDDKKDNKLTID